MNCPLCKGKGKIEEPSRPLTNLELREKIVKVLRKEGFCFREIMSFVGYKSPQSITKILAKSKLLDFRIE